MTLDREKGSSDLGSTECPNCGSSLPLVAEGDGSVAASACKKCFGTTKKEMAAAEPVAPVVAGQPHEDPSETEKASSLTREAGTSTEEN